MEKDHLEVLLEDIRSKFDLVLEGHDVLHREIITTREELREEFRQEIAITNMKIDAVHDKLDAKIDAVHDKLDAKIDAVKTELDTKIDSAKEELGRKIDAVADDLAAHRADTESHRVLYTVKE